MGPPSSLWLSNRVYWHSCTTKTRPPIPCSLGHQTIIDQEVWELLSKEAVHFVQPNTQQEPRFIRSLFVITKKGGGQRPVINLKPLNCFIRYEHFKMESIHILKGLLKKGDYMVKIDLKDAYLTVPIWQNHQKYLRFLWRDSLLEFACLPFGLASAPRAFTKLLKPVLSILRQKGIPRRYPSYGSLNRAGPSACCFDSKSSRRARLYSELSKLSTSAFPKNGVPRVTRKLIRLKPQHPQG